MINRDIAATSNSVYKTLHILGENIRLARKRRRLTQKSIAERAGLSRFTVQGIEKGNCGVAMGN
jgi:DNA-binding XRE family transcriptional regulator